MKQERDGEIETAVSWRSVALESDSAALAFAFVGEKVFESDDLVEVTAIGHERD